MQIHTTPLPGVQIFIPDEHTDARGGLIEQYHLQRYQQAGITQAFVQLNHSYSKQNVLRGLHLQRHKPQGKLIFVTQGSIFDVVVDINPRSATFKQYFSLELSAHNRKQLWVPPGYAHGFLALRYTPIIYALGSTIRTIRPVSTGATLSSLSIGPPGHPLSRHKTNICRASANFYCNPFHRTVTHNVSTFL